MLVRCATRSSPSNSRTLIHIPSSLIISIAIQKDWDARDFVETVELNIFKITEFLNNFDRATRQKLAVVNGKMSKVCEFFFC